MSEHTKGKWERRRHDVVSRNADGSQFRICTIIQHTVPEEDKANAKLIAAAPDLLAACKRDAELANAAISVTLSGKYRNKLTEINILRLAAIAQAEEVK